MELSGELHAQPPESPDNKPHVTSSSGYSALFYLITDDDGNSLMWLSVNRELEEFKEMLSSNYLT